MNCENRKDPDLVQAFLKKWWVESDFKAPNLPLSLRLKVSGCHYNSIYNNTWTKQVKHSEFGNFAITLISRYHGAAAMTKDAGIYLFTS
jgi:hypothetical protein